MKNFLSSKNYLRLRSYVLAHKTLRVGAAVVLLLASYWGIHAFGNTSGLTLYTLAAVQKGTIVTSVTGSGQVSASNQLDLKPKVSGDVVYIGATEGSTVPAGTLIVELDAQDAQKAVRDAQVNL